MNNQSLVILFSFGGKNLLFAGDAQWGNWENFLYGVPYGTPGHTTMTAQSQAILEKIDFYKVGHHGSANATPKEAVAALPDLFNKSPTGMLYIDYEFPATRRDA